MAAAGELRLPFIRKKKAAAMMSAPVVLAIAPTRRKLRKKLQVRGYVALTPNQVMTPIAASTINNAASISLATLPRQARREPPLSGLDQVSEGLVHALPNFLVIACRRNEEGRP
jgi:hypothetical protein